MEPPDHDEREYSRTEVLRRAAGVGAALALPAFLASPAAAAPVQRIKRGGTLRVGIRGVGGSNLGRGASLSPVFFTNELDLARTKQIFERLVTEAPDGSRPNQLAAEFSPNKRATVWKVKLRNDIEWHDGTQFTAKDVVYTFKYILNPKNKAEALAELSSFLKPSGVRALDKFTVEFRLTEPHGLFPDVLSSRTMWIFKAGAARNWNKPVGTGPWKFDSWRPGAQSILVPNKDYRVHNGPYLDRLVLVDISDPQARLNGLLSGQVDAIAQIDAVAAQAIRRRSNLRALVSPSGGYVPFTMFVDTAPFNDVRVRQALRLVVNRPQMVQSVTQGTGRVGNDLPGITDPLYADSIPQRQYDPERARALLRQAGKEDLTVTLSTGDGAPGMLAASTIFAEQAKAAGIKVELDVVPPDQFWNVHYLKKPFTMSQWANRTLDTYFAASYASTALYPETHWKNARWDALYKEARATTEPVAQKRRWAELQRMLWNSGGAIIWGFDSTIDGYNSKVLGLKKNPARWLGWYDFLDASLK
jgi:peptide/nickel transport system substrate-binding protein